MIDALVVGGGFYGAAIALYLRRTRGFERVVIAEREPQLLGRASYHNQARIHAGYHYPRSFTTAMRSRVNLPRFLADYPRVVVRDFTKLYAIARRNSKVTAKQFVRLCREIGASLEPAPKDLVAHFEPRLIEAVFVTEEYAFDAAILREQLSEALTGIDVRLATPVNGVQDVGDAVLVRLGEHEERARYVFNCTYSGLNHVRGLGAAALKHEITELALVTLPSSLAGLGVTVMDGPFFSTMPFPSRRLHSFSHVRYTPHRAWIDDDTDPYRRLAEHPRESRVDRMLRDAARYMPALADARHVESLYEVKTLLVKNEVDDGRPILFLRHGERCFSVLGGKIDNVYDILARLDSTPLP